MIRRFNRALRDNIQAIKELTEVMEKVTHRLQEECSECRAQWEEEQYSMMLWREWRDENAQAS